MSVLKYGNITCVPSFHNRLQFAQAVRQTFQDLLPDVVAIELPDIYYSDILQAIERLPKLSLLCLEEQADTLSYIPIFPSDAMIEAIRLGRANRLPIALVDLAVKGYNIQDTDFAVPDDYMIQSVGLEAFYETTCQHMPPSQSPQADAEREAHMAARLGHLADRFERILFVCGMQHWEPIKAHLAAKSGAISPHQTEGLKTPFLAKLAANARPYLLEEIPYMVLHYELSRRFGLPYDRVRLLKQLLREAREVPALKDENYSMREIQNVLTYAMKLTRIDKRLFPDLYNLVLAAKQSLGDDFAIEVLDRANAYPYEDDADLPEIAFDEEQGFLMGDRSIQLQRRLPTSSKKGPDWIDLEIVRKKQEELAENYTPMWFFFGGFFSHVPEDLVLEGFIDRLGDKLASESHEAPQVVQEFKGSLLDGLDMRETIRNRHLGKIYVKEYKSKRVQLGAWILIFDEDLSDQEYPWMMSLSAEHHNESDIAFYASNPAMHPVTRDIIRGKYGAMLALKPALPDEDKILWEDLDVDEELRKEQLLRLAIRLSPCPGVLYLSEEPPEPYYFQMAKTHDRVLFHLPLSRISQRHLKRIQQFHLLSRKDIRKIADDYI